jgi:hypothetical protein
VWRLERASEGTFFKMSQKNNMWVCNIIINLNLKFKSMDMIILNF